MKFSSNMIFIIAFSILLVVVMLYWANMNKSQTTTSESDGLVLNTKTAMVAGGCFWCVESDLEKLPGVIEAISGYAGGKSENPTYQDYTSGGHREVVEIKYDEDVLSFAELITYALKHMDPTDDHGSFGDRGDSYAPALYYANDNERATIESVLNEIEALGVYKKPLAVDIEARPKFWPAEDYHQNYYQGSSALKYKFYRQASGRDKFIKEHWGEDTGPRLPKNEATANSATSTSTSWQNFQKPNATELKNSLTPLQYKVTQEEGTEPAFTNEYWDNKEPGIYVDVISGEPLFLSIHKYDSGTGWPSFTQPIGPTVVTERIDKKLWQTRTEVRSALAGSHLGHVFTDGPKESTGLRYCLNSAALRFVPLEKMAEGGYGDYLSYFD